MIPDTEENKPDQPRYVTVKARQRAEGVSQALLSWSYLRALEVFTWELSQQSLSHQVPLPRDILHPSEGMERYSPRHQQGRSQAARRSPWHSLGTCFLLNKQEASENSSRMSEVSHPLHRPQLRGGCQGPLGRKACSATSKLHTRQGPYRHWDDFLTYKGWGGIEAQMKVWL